MVHSIGIKVKALETKKMDYYTGKKLHAVILDILSGGDKSSTKELHDKQQPKEFTVSPLLGIKENTLIEGASAYFRVSFLTDKVYKKFKNSIGRIALEGRGLSIGGVKLDIDEIIYKDSQFARRFPKDLTNQKLEVKFLSPTLFKSGDIFIRYPEKTLMFRSLMKKYNLYNSDKISEEVLDKLHLVEFERIETRHRKEYLKKFFIKGFVGRIVININTKDKKFIEEVNRLIHYGYFSGLGHKVSMGFGQMQVNSL